MMEKKGASPKVEEDTAAYRIPFVLLIASRQKFVGVIKQYFFILLKVAVFIPYNPVVLFAKLEFHIA